MAARKSSWKYLITPFIQRLLSTRISSIDKATDPIRSRVVPRGGEEKINPDYKWFTRSSHCSASSPRRFIICKLRSNFNCLRCSSRFSKQWGSATNTQETYSSF
ncbi:hypothetical protein CEXT_457961 [Caerostris extrusa]|uniref:Uncharacterized protein n=1 Tax=Caerostris extrusa TaxID=172846 RepID=A0AAV4TDU3_CAEEX|nr:hypothetical protein CEXT_457961 [Caerostris extrusa]